MGLGNTDPDAYIVECAEDKTTDTKKETEEKSKEE